MASKLVKAGSVVALSAWFVAASAASALAQVEASIDFGYTASEGVNASESRPLLGQTYSSIDIASGSTFGFTVGAFVNEQLEVEFLWHRQFSALEVSDPAPTLRLANQNVDNYHGNLVYNWGSRDAKVRPFAFGGLGATHYAPGDYDSSLPGGAAAEKIGSFTKFSSTWGGGVKVYPAPNVGFKGTLRWTPTYIKSDPAGLWCDPFYPTCWVVGDPDYSNQFEFSASVAFRFGSL